MTRLERLAVLVTLLAVVALLLLAQPVAGAFGVLVGLAVGLLVADRFARVRRRVDARLGADLAVPVTGLRVQVVIRRLLLQVAVLAALLVVAIVVPLVGDRVFALLATAATVVPAVLSVQRLRG